ncbi:MAG: DUF5666 domain-containing protein [Deltaproteobacteria bacterium]|nr:DUF5666 domain-containing protein [Deltaproteobacteria bacterium]MDH3383530.1 DUF5666 domain-containing protein [Deltaproteobacteria bacterium]
MTRFRISIPCLVIVFALSLALMTTSSCGDGIGDLAGGGTGGTGISTGPITGFGSVVLNNAHYNTDDEVAPGFKTKKIVKGIDKSNAKDRDIFRVGMVVTLQYSSRGNNTSEIDYEPNLQGPVASKVPGPQMTVRVLGRDVILDNAAFFNSLGIGNVVEVSGFIDDLGRIRATFAEVKHLSPTAGEEFEIKGYISGLLPSDNSFQLGALPDGSGNTVTVSYTPGAVQDLPAGPANGMYVQVVTTDPQPLGGEIAAIHVKPFIARTNFPENRTVDLDGLVTKLESGSGNILSFDLEGKGVQTDDSTEWIGGTATDIQPNVRLQIQGKETGGVLLASKIFFR